MARPPANGGVWQGAASGKARDPARPGVGQDPGSGKRRAPAGHVGTPSRSATPRELLQRGHLPFWSWRIIFCIWANCLTSWFTARRRRGHGAVCPAQRFTTRCEKARSSLVSEPRDIPAGLLESAREDAAAARLIAEAGVPDRIVGSMLSRRSRCS